MLQSRLNPTIVAPTLLVKQPLKFGNCFPATTFFRHATQFERWSFRDVYFLQYKHLSLRHEPFSCTQYIKL